MAQPLLLVDSLLSITEYPYLGWNGTTAVGLVDQTGGAGPSGFEAFRVADGRRSTIDYWLGATNADSFVSAVCYGIPAGLTTPALLPRTASCFVLDRGHNLSGFVLNLFASQDNYATNQTVFSITIPAVTGGQPSDPNGALTEEGAWIKLFATPITAAYWKVDIPAMGVGIAPQVVGMWLGLAYQPAALYRPYDEGSAMLAAAETVSPLLWRGRGLRGVGREGTHLFRALDDFDYELMRFHLGELFASGRPMWIVQDQARAGEAYLAIPALGRSGFQRPANWAFPVGQVNYQEWEPAILT